MNAGFDLHGVGRTRVQIAADYPVTFSDTVGLFRPADALALLKTSRPGGLQEPTDTAVLFVGSWGFEELCARKFWQRLAVELSRRGMASMRFDYPGTGDALDHQDYATGLDVWLDTIRAAAEKLKELSGAQRVVLIGHGIGGALAWRASENMDCVAGLALAAPALSGRHWLREFVALSRIANEGAIQTNPPASGPAMGEQIIPQQVAVGLRSVNIASATKAPAPHILLLKQENRHADVEFAEHIKTLGVEVRSTDFEGYDRFIRDVLFSVPPVAAIETLAEWAKDVADRGIVDGARISDVPVPTPGVLMGRGFTETPVRFGEGDRLYGVLAEPMGPRKGATVLVLPTGYERASGWGRISAQLCRELARAGIASLRFDMANIADSPPVPTRPEQIIYGDGQLKDVEEATDFLEQRQLFPVVVTGRCSGGWAAFKSGVRDPRFSGVVAVNVFDFYIPPDADVEALLISSRQPLASYGAKLISGGFWRRVLSGKVRIRNGIVNLWAMIISKAISFATPLMVRFPFLSPRFHTLSKDFKAIAAHDTQMTVVFTEGDIGAAMLETNFGPRGRMLSCRYGNPRIVFIADADHNLTTAEARHAWAQEVEAIAFRFPPYA
ncbi:alpha/beta fold hydrolase [Agrobacterium rubi]|uniref:alpha/beta fold hydrolase n=1 Tax=Agrobacterium rubi TaxID=28099 RepID=UPI0015726721|nr:alpha/beta fold hydrolase [Agrobacterium rubi]NTF09638.1 alpha/beta fold hydrolase [Agrobacterium rubi]NTF22545.1 alpha/beta fold hydrolase [Agrobacterium rubi]NTF29402.1 alpha/beta fold hydrolase [Agrobacterium rubi]